MRVVVLGAGGKVGRLIVPLLAQSGHDVIGVIHRPESAASVSASGGDPVVVDLEGDTGPIRDVLTGADAVVWAAGADIMTGPEHSDRLDRDGALRTIEVADEVGVGRWVQISSLYADRIELAPPVLTHFLTNKAAADAAVRASGISWTVVRPGGLPDDPGTGTVEIADQMTNARVTRADVAAVIAELLNRDTARDVSFDLGAGTAPIADAVASL
jgi:uncharacterized protein YbjT (DUF2867 family)